MNKQFFITGILIFSILFSLNSYAQGHKIKIKIKGVENQKVILGYHKNDNLIPADTVMADKNGMATFSGEKPLREGLYFIFLPNRRYFDFIVSKDQDFTIENDTADVYKNVKFKGSEENTLLKNYHNFLMGLNKKMVELQEKLKNAKTEKEKKKINADIKSANDEYTAYYQKSLKDNEGTFFATFIKATREVEVPKEITDQTKRYYYYRNHYFDNFDVSDPRLLYTQFYEKKIDTYFDKVLIQDPDTLIAECDIMLEKTKNDKELYKYMLIHLFNKFAKSKLMFAENVYVHLGYIYVDKAVWSTDSFKNQLKPKLDRKSNCLPGNTAKNIVMQTLPQDSADIDDIKIFLEDMKERGLEIENDESRTFEETVPDLSELIAEFMGNFNGYKELSALNTKYTILWFYEPDCGHCKKLTPEVYKAYNNELKDFDLSVMCIYLERNTDDWNKFSNHIGKWFDFVQKNKMYGKNWYNVWNPFEKHRHNYDIQSTPVMYLLDKDKKIIAKRIGHEQVIEIIKSMEGVK